MVNRSHILSSSKKAITAQDPIEQNDLMFNLGFNDEENEYQSSHKNQITVINTRSKIVNSKVYDTYWRFAAERQRVFFARQEGKRLPWTDDPILKNYKFTNVYRASDRVSQYLIQKVIYNKVASNDPKEIFFRILLFKLFNKINTWELFENEIGYPNYEEFSVEHYDKILNLAKEQNLAIYSSAYIMPSGGGKFRNSSKHTNHLLLLKKIMDDEVPKKIQNMDSMKSVYECLLQYPTIGKFLAFQFTIDLNYSEIINFNEMDFVVPGPGASDGIKKCFLEKGDLSDSDIIKLVTEQQEEEFKKRDIDFETLWGRKLHLIDCQNLFCEVDKYSRVAHPDVKGNSGRNRIKAKFCPSNEKINYFFPPKWDINKFIKKVETKHSNVKQISLANKLNVQLKFKDL